jgi:lipopolysaccharide transport system permease protein
VTNHATTNSSNAREELVLEAGRMEGRYWRDLWKYRELLGFLAWRDVKVRYQQTVLGAGWAIVQPLTSVVVFWFVFGRVAKMPSGGQSYFIVVMVGQLAWQLFANTLSNTSGSLVASSQLVSKVYFPRLVVPLSSVLVALVDFLFVFGIYVIAAVWTKTMPGFHALLLPVFIALALVLAIGAGLWLCALTVRFRDFRILVPFLLQIGVFATPVGYRTDYLNRFKEILAINPMTGVIDAFRWSLLGDSEAFSWNSFIPSLCWAAVLLSTGIWYFRKTEKTFADDI